MVSVRASYSRGPGPDSRQIRMAARWRTSCFLRPFRQVLEHYPSYTSRCVQSVVAEWLRPLYFPPIYRVTPLRWQECYAPHWQDSSIYNHYTLLPNPYTSVCITWDLLQSFLLSQAYFSFLMIQNLLLGSPLTRSLQCRMGLVLGYFWKRGSSGTVNTSSLHSLFVYSWNRSKIVYGMMIN